MSTDREHLYLEDREARSAAQREFVHPVIVEAGAGTGKTSILVARIVAWCLGPGWEKAQCAQGEDALAEDIASEVVGGVVAITFTDAAAAEMAERVATALTSIERDEWPIGVDARALPDPDICAQRCTRILAELFRLRVRTIHAFCLSLLQRYPVEAGLDPAFSVDADGFETEAIVFEVVEAAARKELLPSPNEKWLRLASAEVGLPEMANALIHFVAEGVSPELLRRDPFPESIIDNLHLTLVGALDAFFEAERGCLQNATRAKSVIRCREELENVKLALGKLEPVSIGAMISLAAGIGDSSLKKLGDWSQGKRTTKAELEALLDVGEHFSGRCRDLNAALADLRALNPEGTRLGAEISGDLLEEILRLLRKKGIVSFHDLLGMTHDLLANHGWLCSEIRAEISQLLVDEFQDTDRLQCEIVRLLSLDCEVSDRPGLFIVGDPKQSIYGWRNADLAAYESFKAAITANGGMTYRLSVNYRSAPPILNEVEHVIANVMVEESGLQPPFEPLLPCPDKREDPGFDDDPWCGVEYWVSWPFDEDRGTVEAGASVARANEVEAQALARDMVELHVKSAVPWSEMAVLLRSTGALDTIVDSLRAHNVPHTVARDREYYRRREIIETASLVRVVIDPTDQLALLTLLRSDVVGVPDAALIPLWQNGFATLMCDLNTPEDPALDVIERAVAEARDSIPGWVPGLERIPEWPRCLIAAIRNVAALRQSFENQAPDIFVERLRALFLSEASAALRYLGRYRRARLQQFFNELEHLLCDPEAGSSDISRFLRRAILVGQENRQSGTLDTATDAVQVMTMHKAKGLDFDHVYLMQLHRGSGGPPGQPSAKVLRRSDQTEYSIFSWPTPAFLVHKRWAQRVEEAERVRLLYVAMTRARKRLVIAGQWPEKPPDPSAEPERLIDLVLHRGSVESLHTQAEDGLVRRRDTDIMWVLPGLSDPTPYSFDDAPPPKDINLEKIEAQAHILAHQRKKAQMHMNLPFANTASGLENKRLRFEAQIEEFDDRNVTAPPHIAAEVGTLIHQMIEELDLHLDLGAQINERRPELKERLRTDFGESAESNDASAALKRLDGLLETIIAGSCLRRLSELSDHVIGREIPVLAEPVNASAYTSGQVDLLYRNPETGALVVADFKTDVISTSEIAARLDKYSPQLELYRSAITSCLGEEVEAEIWFLHLDEIVGVG